MGCNSPLLQLRWTCFLSQRHYLCTQQRHANVCATIFRGCDLVVPPIRSHGTTIITPHGTHHESSASPTSILIESVLMLSIISFQPTCDEAVEASRCCWGRLSYCLFHITAQQYSYMYCWDVNPPLPQLHWTCFLPQCACAKYTPMRGVQQPFPVENLLHRDTAWYAPRHYLFRLLSEQQLFVLMRYQLSFLPKLQRPWFIQ